MRKLVILRPEPAASTTFDRAAELGLDPVKVPLFEIESVAWEAPDPAGFDGLLLTSANVVRDGGEELAKLRALPVYAVGPATAQAARSAGFEVAAVGRAGIRKLLSSIDADLRLIHIAGEDRIDYRLAWQKITPIIAYRARALDIPDPSLLEGSVVLVHSPRAGTVLTALEFDRSRSWVAAISTAAAEACGIGWAGRETATQPTDAALLALASRLCEKEPGR